MANVATSVEYLTGHRNLNLHGVMTPAFFGTRTVEKEAGFFEALNRLPADERPPYLLTTVSGQESSALLRELVEGAPLYRSFSLGDDLLVFRTRWDLLGRSLPALSIRKRGRRSTGSTEVDRLNVCDVRDEAAHDTATNRAGGTFAWSGAVRIDSYDGASGSEVGGRRGPARSSGTRPSACGPRGVGTSWSSSARAPPSRGGPRARPAGAARSPRSTRSRSRRPG